MNRSEGRGLCFDRVTAAQGAEFVVVLLRMRSGMVAPADSDRPLQYASQQHRSAISAADMSA